MPFVRVLYNGTDISEDVSRSLIQVVYTDNMDEADTVDIVLEDKELKWQNEWYPSKGAKLDVVIGYEGAEELECGQFEIDELITTGPPDVVTIRGIAAGFTQGKKRTDKSYTHETKTLAEIVRTIAANAGLNVKGNIENIRIDRSVQNAQRDMRYLRRLANQFGYTFNIRGNDLNFFKRANLESAKAVGSFDKTDLVTYSITDKSTRIYSAAEVRFHNPTTGELVRHKEVDRQVDFTDDVLIIEQKAESLEQAQVIAKSYLEKANKLQQSGSVSMPGNPFVIAGNVIELTGLGKMSGNYIIRSSAHTVDVLTGWVSDLDIYKVGFIQENKYKPKDKQAAKNKRKSESYTGPMAKGDTDNFGFYNN